VARRLIITGSNRGTGRAIAEAFHEEGYEVASLNRTLDGAGWLGEIQCDLRDAGAVRAGVRQALETLGGVDVCVASAAVRRLTPVSELSDDDWADSLAVNLTSVFVLARETLPPLRKTGGRLVVIGSEAGTRPFEGGAAYCSTKAALKAFCDVLVMEELAHGVTTTLITPGSIRNRPKTLDEHKMDPASVASVVLGVVDTPRDVLVGEIELRPTNPVPSPLVGIDRLQCS
jgi:3-oxoacyl-[acyl-carrier protein] reductase